MGLLTNKQERMVRMARAGRVLHACGYSWKEVVHEIATGFSVDRCEAITLICLMATWDELERGERATWQ
jgi:hypothetical protein